jgi:hypothetical protein
MSRAFCLMSDGMVTDNLPDAPRPDGQAYVIFTLEELAAGRIISCSNGPQAASIAKVGATYLFRKQVINFRESPNGALHREGTIKESITEFDSLTQLEKSFFLAL